MGLRSLNVSSITRWVFSPFRSPVGLRSFSGSSLAQGVCGHSVGLRSRFSIVQGCILPFKLFMVIQEVFGNSAALWSFSLQSVFGRSWLSSVTQSDCGHSPSVGFQSLSGFFCHLVGLRSLSASSAMQCASNGSSVTRWVFGYLVGLRSPNWPSVLDFGHSKGIRSLSGTSVTQRFFAHLMGLRSVSASLPVRWLCAEPIYLRRCPHPFARPSEEINQHVLAYTESVCM